MRPVGVLSRVGLWVDRNLPALFLAIFLVGYGLSNMVGVFGDPIRSDGVGYHAYLPALVLHGDPSYRTLAEDVFGGRIPAWTGIRPLEHGGYLNRYTPGLAVMMLPFFLLAHVVTLAMQSPPGAPEWFQFNFRADGFSFFYQQAAGLGGVAYLMAGLLLLRGILRLHFRPAVVLVTMLTLVFGTNLLNYGMGESFSAHVVVFFLVVVLMRAVPWWQQSPERIDRALVLGLLVGILALVRPTALLAGLLIPLYGVSRPADARPRNRWLRQHAIALAVMAATAALVVGIQPLLNRMSSGAWIYDAYAQQGEGFFWRNPKWWQVLVSPKHGAFLFAPTLVLAVAGLAFLRGTARVWLGAAWIYVLGTYYAVASWNNWWLGGAFGHRGFIDVYPLLAFGWAAILDRVWDHPRRRAALVATLAVMSAWTLFWLKLYYTRELPIEGLDRAAMYDVFWWRAQMVKAWWGT